MTPDDRFVPMDILTQLKLETRTRHEQTERLLYAQQLMAGLLTRDEYVHLLTIHYRFHQALEAAVTKQAGALAGYDYQASRKTPWLVADLQRMGVPLPSPAADLFAGWNATQLLGALYVAEGSMLGGQVIAKALRRTPALTDVDSQFFGGYGAQTGPRWKAFCTYLTQRAEGHQIAVVAAADQAFSYFQQLAA